MNKLELLKNINEYDSKDIIETWETSVIATHLFLTKDDIESIKPEVLAGASFVEHFYVIRDDNNIIRSFLGVHNKKVEMLFVHNDFRSKGLGTKLIKFAIENLNVSAVDVNEQNPLAVDFYKNIGFEVLDRSETDDQGRNFPILFMRLKNRQ
jgi:putative acetyltransferase